MIRLLYFNLVELLVVIAMLLIMASLMMPSLKKINDTSKQMICVNNQRALSHGFSFFSLDNNNTLPYGSWGNNSSKVYRAWDDFIQPYFSKDPLTQKEMDLVKMPKGKAIEELLCPSSIVGREQVKSWGVNINYIMPMKTWRVKDSDFIGNGTTGPKSIEPEFRPLYQVIEPNHTILLAEMDVSQAHFVQGLGRVVASPLKQVDAKSSGLTFTALENYSLFLHPNSDLGYLFVDGHVEVNAYDSPSLIGDGTVEKPKGAWTVAGGD